MPGVRRSPLPFFFLNPSADLLGSARALAGLSALSFRAAAF